MQLETLEASRGAMETELQRMKAEWERSQEELTKEIGKENSKIIDKIEELRLMGQKTDMQLNITTSKSIQNHNYINEL
jgi:hypothetical protein